MSFTTEIKQEVSFSELKECCSRAELSALIQLTSSLTISNQKMIIVVKTENPTTAKRVVSLLHNVNVETQLKIAKKTNLKKNNVYTIDIKQDAKTILEKLGLYSESKGLLDHPSYLIVSKDCCARAYLAGAFIAYGSCNSPNNSNYHLELSVNDIDHANFIIKLLSRFNIEAKIAKRRGKYVVYIKKAEVISDFLRLIGANESLMNFENIRINRDYVNSINRISNCEIANDMKTLKASEKQIEHIQKIIDADKYKYLDEKLRNAIDIRLQYKDHSLQELCNIYQKKYGDIISKSGMKHRLNKIETIAKELEASEKRSKK